VRAACEGETFAELLEAAAKALYAVAFRRMEERRDVRRSISIEAQSPEETVVRWLQELIFFMETERFAAVRFAFERAEARKIQVEAQGYEYDPADREDEVKAATYHGMRVTENETGWRAEVIFDL
jgi:SHS2 domain-containing protein